MIVWWSFRFFFWSLWFFKVHWLVLFIEIFRLERSCIFIQLFQCKWFGVFRCWYSFLIIFRFFRLSNWTRETKVSLLWFRIKHWLPLELSPDLPADDTINPVHIQSRWALYVVAACYAGELRRRIPSKQPFGFEFDNGINSDTFVWRTSWRKSCVIDLLGAFFFRIMLNCLNF